MALATGKLLDNVASSLLIGAPGTGAALRGSAYVVPVTVPLDDINALSANTTFTGEADGNRLGSAVALGDFLASAGKGFALGGPGFSTNQGIVYPVDKSQLSGGIKPFGTSSPRFRGMAAQDQAGTAITVGDITGDGVDDLIVGVPFYDTSTTTTDTGAVYAFPGPVPLSAAGIVNSAPIKLLGSPPQSGYQAGSSLAVVDINADGKNDLVVGAPRYDVGNMADAGAVFVFFGPLSGVQSFSTPGLTLTGGTAGELAGATVVNAGDLDKDGRQDLLIGAPASGGTAGKAYLLYGGAISSSSISLGTLPRFMGTPSDQAGAALLGPGDINADGFNDVLIGAPGHTTNTGAVYVVYGTAARFPASTALGVGARYTGPANGSEAGRALAALGDVDGDGAADFAVGAPGFTSNSGAVYLILGHGPRWWYPDNDNDRFGKDVGATRQCGEPAPNSKQALVGGDCDDSDSSMNPHAPEVCDEGTEKDNNCDGLKGDELGSGAGGTKTWARDGDGDKYIYYKTVTSTPTCAPPASTGWINFADTKGVECDPPEGTTNPNFTTDNDATIHQFAPEVCDNKDNDCNGAVDDDPAFWANWYPDADKDTFGAKENAKKQCAAPAGHVSNDTDCDDTSNISYPGAPEICDTKDNNCNNTVDEGVLITYYRDADGDGHGVLAQTLQACSKPTGYAAISDDCNDSATNGAQMYPGKAEVCDGLDNNCNFDTDEGVKTSFHLDADKDGHGNPYVFVLACTAPNGYAASNQDCNDSSATTKPGVSEVCDGKDNNCNGTVDEGVLLEWYPDADSDGVGTTQVSFRILACAAPAGYVASHADCHDGNATVKPGIAEVCDALDNDCDGSIDEGLPPISWYSDADGDGFGNASGTALVACRLPGAGYVSNKTDCNDGNARINPAQVEVCEPAGQPQTDNNCDGSTENAVNGTPWYRDADSDGFGTRAETLKRCTQPAGYVTTDTDCADNNPLRNPGKQELCEQDPDAGQVDNDCDNDSSDVDPTIPVEDGGTRLWYGDADKDGHAGPGFKLRWCTNPSNLTDGGTTITQGAYLATEPDDCNDSNSSVFQRLTWYEDQDRDGCGNADAGVVSCGSPAGCGFPFVTNNKDLDDRDAGPCPP
ncbi:MopE-related protein [Stigmatella erecta]|uniref:Putative metal-binding motif-containing protein n=1 Tax=Stigmatella erecta TaxID=83460 RepID=A0A1I0FSI6_9BACT|nr:MopE-related protein [Stigmatella erecta]SET61129.1 Putative metal-binding motif-containing protein [Stigmatella erecta]